MNIPLGRMTLILVVLILMMSLYSSASPSLTAMAAEPRTLYVDQNNSSCLETGTGTIEQPFCSITPAAKKATAGTHVVVSGGTYREQVTVTNSGLEGQPIVFYPLNDVPVIIRDQTHGFKVSNKHWIVIQDFTITNTRSYGISVESSSHIMIVNNHVTKSGQPLSGLTKSGIYFKNTTDSEISGNLSDYNSNAGIFLNSGTTRTRVSHNTTTYNARGWQRAAAGIDVRSSGNTIIGNMSHHNEDSGLQFYQGASDNLVIDNAAYLNGDHGIDISSSPGQTVTNNIVYNNVTAGINVEGHDATPSINTTLRHNISVDNGLNSPRTKSNIRVDTVSKPGTTLDDDVVYLSQPGVMLVWGSSSFSSLADFQKKTDQELQGQQVDPQWIDPINGNFQFRPTSSLIHW